MADVALWTLLVALLVAAWAPVALELRDEFRTYRSTPTRRRARSPRHAVDALRSRVGDRHPEFASERGASPHSRRIPRTATGRDMPPVGTWRVTVPTGGPHTNHGRPVCG